MNSNTENIEKSTQIPNVFNTLADMTNASKEKKEHEELQEMKDEVEKLIHSTGWALVKKEVVEIIEELEGYTYYERGQTIQDYGVVQIAKNMAQDTLRNLITRIETLAEIETHE
jgi:hypothetical protein